MNTKVTNTSIFDHPYYEALFGGAEFPDGTFMIDAEEDVIEFQKIFMEVMSECRSHNMMTFPVNTISLLRQNGKFVDEEFARWACEHNMKWSDSNLFVDDSVNSLSNCPLAPDTNILYYNERYHKYLIRPIKELYNSYGEEGKPFRVLSNGKEIHCKVNKFDIPVEYEIELANGATLKTTANHLNKVLGDREYVPTTNLTLDDYLPFGLHPYKGQDNLTYEEGFIVGMFLGDGSYKNDHDVVFSLNKEKKNELIDFLNNYAVKKFGGVITESPCVSAISGKNSCFNIGIQSDYLRGLIQMFVDGNNALTKGINGKAFCQSIQFRLGIIEGLYATDGGNNNRIYTFSERLKDDLLALLATLGKVGNVMEDNREGRLSENTCYVIRYYEPNNRTKLKDVYVIDDNYFWVKIKSIKKLTNKGATSYCLEVLGDEEPIFTLANGIITHNCRLKSDIRELGYFNSIGGTALKVGSVKVSTINLARLALENKTEEEYLKALAYETELDLIALDCVRHIIKRNVEKGLLKNFSYGIIDFEHLYNTIGFIGIFETMRSFGYTKRDEFGNTYYTPEASAFGEKIFKTMRAVADKFIERYNCDYMINTEQIPGESAAAKLMKKDKFFYGNDVIDDLPLYGNQFIPLGIKTTFQERIRIASEFDKYCNGGSIVHANTDAPFDSFDKAWKMMNYIADQGVTYYAFNTKIQACEDNHAFYGTTCPVCGKPVDSEYTRIVGFYTNVKTYSKERKNEFKMRRWEPMNTTVEGL